MPVLPGITISLDDSAVPSETRVVVASVPHVVVMTTTLPDQAITVTSSYTGHPKLQTQITHLILTPERTRVDQTQLPHDEVPVTRARERCLLEHATAVHDATGAKVDLSSRALQAAGDL